MFTTNEAGVASLVLKRGNTTYTLPPPDLSVGGLLPEVKAITAVTQGILEQNDVTQPPLVAGGFGLCAIVKRTGEAFKCHSIAPITEPEHLE